jgi:hypothetical protein
MDCFLYSKIRLTSIATTTLYNHYHVFVTGYWVKAWENPWLTGWRTCTTTATTSYFTTICWVSFFFYSLLIFLCLIENVLQEKFEDTNDVITIRNLRKDRQTMIDIILHRKLMIEQHEPPLKTRLNSGPTEG